MTCAEIWIWIHRCSVYTLLIVQLQLNAKDSSGSNLHKTLFLGVIRGSCSHNSSATPPPPLLLTAGSLFPNSLPLSLTRTLNCLARVWQQSVLRFIMSHS